MNCTDENREQLLNQLHKITFAAFLTDLISEYCYELIVYTAKGTDYSWISYDEWTAFEVQPIEEAKWDEIRKKIQNAELKKEDLEHTQLVQIINNTVGDKTVNWSERLTGLLQLPSILQNAFYCYYDPIKQSFTFTETQDELKQVLAEAYADVRTLWEDMDTGDLESCLYSYEEEGQEIPCIVFE